MKIIANTEENNKVNYNVNIEVDLDLSFWLKVKGPLIKKVFKSTKDLVLVSVPLPAISEQEFSKISSPVVFFERNSKNNNFEIDSKIKKSYYGVQSIDPWITLEHKETGMKLLHTSGYGMFITQKNNIEIITKLLLNPSENKEFEYKYLDNVYWSKDTLELKDDIKFFLESREWFNTKGIPYKRSYLLYGPPGNGKTTTIKSIAKVLGTEPESFDFSAQYDSPDTAFKNWVLGKDQYITEPCNEDSVEDTTMRLLLLEDVDRLYPMGYQPKTNVTLECLLNVLDGVIENKNVIIIATANHPEDLDKEVILRPGRFDKQVCYNSPSEEDCLTFLKMLFNEEEVSEEAMKEISESPNRGSYATIKSLYVAAAVKAFSDKSRVIQDKHLLETYETMKKNNINEEEQEPRRKIGFD